MSRLVIVSNRTPPPKERTQLAGGLAVGLKDAIKGRDTLWFGWSGNTAENEGERTPKTTTAGELTFATIDLTRQELKGFYEGFSNGLLWPLFHYRVGLMEYHRDDHDAYLAVNDMFARALAPLLRPDDLIWVHDYHLIPLGAALRRQGVQGRIGFFLHIPFPPMALFEAVPRADRLLRDFEAYDLIGLQTEQDAGNMNAAMQSLGFAGEARAFPIGIDPKEFAGQAAKAMQGKDVRRMQESLGDRALILGVDRLDYSKGIPERFRGYARLLERFPEHRKAVTFLQVAPVSRGDVAEYRALRRTLDELAGRINGEFGEFDWEPLRYITRSVPRTTLAGFHRLADVGLVTPLRDGMNLVAKEYVAAQDEADPGVLVLSRFAGAAPELDGAMLVNPHDPDEIAEQLHEALTLGLDQRQARWRRMNKAVQTATAERWGQSFVAQLAEVPLRDGTEVRRAG